MEQRKSTGTGKGEEIGKEIRAGRIQSKRTKTREHRGGSCNGETENLGHSIALFTLVRDETRAATETNEPPSLPPPGDS